MARNERDINKQMSRVEIKGPKQFRAYLTSQLGSTNLRDWSQIAKAFRGRQLFITIGKKRIAELEGAFGLRQAIEEQGISIATMADAFKAVTQAWLDKTFTGELDLKKVIAHVLPGEKTVADLLITEAPKPEQLPETPPPPALSAPPVQKAQIVARVSPVGAENNQQKVRRIYAEAREFASIKNLPLEHLQRLLTDQLWLVKYCHEKDLKERKAIAFSYAANFQAKGAQLTGNDADYSKAIAYYKRSNELFRSLGNHDRVAGNLSRLVKMLNERAASLADWQEIVQCVQENLHLRRRYCNDEKECAYALSFEGQAQLKIAVLTNDPAIAQISINCYEQAIIIFQSFREVKRIASAFDHISRAHEFIAKHETTPGPEKAVHWDKCAENSKKATGKYRLLNEMVYCANQLFRQALAYVNLSREAEAFSIFLEAYALALKNGDKKLAATSLDHAANNCSSIAKKTNRIEDYERVVELADRSLALFREIGNRDETFIALLSNKQNAFSSLAFITNDAEFHLKNIDTIKELLVFNLENERFFRLLTSLSWSYDKAGEPEKSFEIKLQLAELLPALSEIVPIPEQQDLYLSIGVRYLLRKRVEKRADDYAFALKYFNLALSLGEATLKKGSLAMLWRCRGQAALELAENLDQLRSALEDLDRSLSLYRELDNKPGITYCLNDIGKLYLKLAKTAKGHEREGFYYLDHLASAVDCFNEAQAFHALEAVNIEKAIILKLLAEAQMLIAVATNNSDQYFRAYENNLSSARMFEALGEKERQAHALSYAGTAIFYYAYLAREARYYFEVIELKTKALELFLALEIEQAERDSLVAYCHSFIGNANYSLGLEFGEAKYFRQAQHFTLKALDYFIKNKMTKEIHRHQDRLRLIESA